MAAPKFDEKLGKDFEEAYDEIVQELIKASKSTVKASLQNSPCPKCDCKHIRYIEVPDYKTKLAIVDWASNRVEGRPGQQESGEDKEKIIFQRLVEMPPDEVSG